uniref:PAS domain-containing protein n=1 Tax=Timema douglasi TaxID=61478 RepID=A0A7R8VQP6_TIMDO|nr:unnamed protein product [Timema douglasi]
MVKTACSSYRCSSCVVLVQGHYLSFLPLCSRNEPVFLATCTPVAMPETRECVVQGATNVFTSIHSMDMKFMHIDKNGEFHLGYPRSELQGASWYHLLHWDCMREAQSKHRLITQSEQDRSCILLLRLQRRSGDWLWIHCVLQVKDNMENSQQPVIVCTNQVLSTLEHGEEMETKIWRKFHNVPHAVGTDGEHHLFPERAVHGAGEKPSQEVTAVASSSGQSQITAAAREEDPEAVASTSGQSPITAAASQEDPEAVTSTSVQSPITAAASQEDPEAVASTNAESQIIPATDEDPEAVANVN